MTRSHHQFVLAAFVTAALVVGPQLASASAAAASTAEGCSGVLSSYRADGSFVDLVLVPGVDGSTRDPFRIDPEGYVAWGGAPDSEISSAAWVISMMGVDVAHGTVTDAHKGMMTAGVLDVAQDAAPAVAPAPLSAVATVALRGSAYFPVTFTLNGASSTCTATVWVGGIGEGPSTPMFWASVLLGALGLIVAVAMVVTTRSYTVIDLRPIDPRPIDAKSSAARTDEQRERVAR